MCESVFDGLLREFERPCEGTGDRDVALIVSEHGVRDAGDIGQRLIFQTGPFDGQALAQRLLRSEFHGHRLDQPFALAAGQDDEVRVGGFVDDHLVPRQSLFQDDQSRAPRLCDCCPDQLGCMVLGLGADDDALDVAFGEGDCLHEGRVLVVAGLVPGRVEAVDEVGQARDVPGTALGLLTVVAGIHRNDQCALDDGGHGRVGADVRVIFAPHQPTARQLRPVGPLARATGLVVVEATLFGVVDPTRIDEDVACVHADLILAVQTDDPDGHVLADAQQERDGHHLVGVKLAVVRSDDHGHQSLQNCAIKRG